MNINKEKVINWIKDPYNLTFLGIMFFAFIIRLYYFIITKNQPLWWDEAEYLSGAKSFAGLVDFNLGAFRLPGYPLLMSLFFLLRITNEPTMRFLALFIPSLLVIILTYLCIKEMYPDKKIALISTAIMTVLWEHLFYSNRFHTENFALIFQYLAIFILFKGYLKREDTLFFKEKYALLLVTLFSLLSIFFRPGNMSFIPVIFIWIILLNSSKLFSKGGAIITGLLLLFSVTSLLFYSKIPFFKAFIGAYYHPSVSISFSSLNIFYSFYQSVTPIMPSILFYSFLLGISIFLINFFLSIDLTFKKLQKDSENLKFKSDSFNFLLIIFTLAIFIFILRAQTYELRWFFPFLLGMLVFTSKGIIFFSDYLGKIFKSKKLALFLMIILLFLGMYTQIIHSDKIIKIKKNSYLQVKEAGLWIKGNSNPGDTIISKSIMQFPYYSERKTYNYKENESSFEKFLKEKNVKFLTVSVFEPHPKWIFPWIEKNKAILTPVKAYYNSNNKLKPLLVIYQINKEKLNSFTFN